MSSIFSADSAALLILQQSSLPPLSAGTQPAIADPVLAAGNGGPDSAGSGGRTSILAKARITEALFSVNSLDPTRMKLNLYERLGKELGLSMDDFESGVDFGRAVKQVVDQLRLKPEGRAALAAIEAELGLGKLGLSIDTLIEAMIEPEGDADEKVEAALLREVKEDDKALAALRSFTLDEAGLYTAG